MCRPLKDIVTELEAKYKGFELIYDIDERHQVITDFDRNIEYLFHQFEKYEEDVTYVLRNNLDVNIITRITLNLILIIQKLNESISDYTYAITLYLMDECYEKNRDLWSSFIDARRKLTDLFTKLQENNVFKVKTPKKEYVVIQKMFYDDAVYDRGEYLTKTGMYKIREKGVEKMNGAELIICLSCLLEIFENSLGDLKNSAYRYAPNMINYYERNYLLFAKKYWPQYVDHFRSHVESHRLRGHVDISDLERLRDETIREFEYNSTVGKIWCEYSDDITQMAFQMKDQKLDEDQWKYFFKELFKIEEYDRWIEELKNPASAPKGFSKYVTKPDKTDDIISLIKRLVKMQNKPRLIMMPIRAAIDAGALERPNWNDFLVEFGENLIKSKTSFSNYTDPTKKPYDSEAYTQMVNNFKRIISE